MDLYEIIVILIARMLQSLIEPINTPSSIKQLVFLLGDPLWLEGTVLHLSLLLLDFLLLLDQRVLVPLFIQPCVWVKLLRMLSL